MLMPQTPLKALYYFDQEDKPMTLPEIREKHPDFPPGNAVVGTLTRDALIKKTGPKGKVIYQITIAGKERLARELELAPIEEHPEPRGSGAKYDAERKRLSNQRYRDKQRAKKQGELSLGEEPKPKRKYKRRKKQEVVVSAPPPPPNLSASAETLVANLATVLEENARLRDTMQAMYNQLGELLYGSSTKEVSSNISDQE